MSDKKTLILSYSLSFLALAFSVNGSFASIICLLAASALLVRFLNRNKPLNIPAHILLGILQSLLFVFSLRTMLSISVMFLVISGLNILFSQFLLYAFYQTRKSVRRSTSFLTTVIFLALVILMLAADVSIKLLLHSAEYGVLTGFWQMALMIAILNVVMLVMPAPARKQPHIATKLVHI